MGVSFSEFFFIEQDVELKRDLEISGVSLNVYNLWVSSLAMVGCCLV